MADLLPHSLHGTGKITEAHRREIFADPGHRFHGTLTAYTYGCRCDPCGDARRAYDQARKAGA